MKFILLLRLTRRLFTGGVLFVSLKTKLSADSDGGNVGEGDCGGPTGGSNVCHSGIEGNSGMLGKSDVGCRLGIQ